MAAECLEQQIYVHLDNHVSKAIWCCSTTDGNAWFGDTYFNVANWKRGLSYMASHGASWGNLMSMSLRNELRSPEDEPSLASSSYNWENWYENIVPAANAINAANPNVLIFLSGLNYDTDLSPIPIAGALGGGYTFHKSSFSYANKLVLEIHNYATTTTSCSSLESSLYSTGYNALDSTNSAVVNVMPVVMTEFGHLQDDATYATVYSTCLESYLTGIHGGWMIWVLAGSYYIRQGIEDYDETWGVLFLDRKARPLLTIWTGLLTHNWSAWRDPNGISSVIIPMVAGTKTF